MHEERLIEIEIKLTRQEDLVEALNQMVYQQQKQIDQLNGLCAALSRHIKDMPDGRGDQPLAHEKPPHY